MKASASARMLSLFTGKTDLEAGPKSRDGSEAGERPIQRRRLRRALDWRGSFERWWVEDKDQNETHLVERTTKGKYRAWALGKELGTFDTIAEAGQACERAK